MFASLRNIVMKNRSAIVLVVFLLLLSALGCSSLNPLSGKTEKAPTPTPAASPGDKTLTDKTVDSTVGDEKIGVPECDEVMDMITAEANNPDDNYIVKAGKALFFNRIKESIRESVEKNKNDREELAKNCRDYKVQLVKYKAEEDQKKKNEK
jgi:hypothetical protein